MVSKVAVMAIVGILAVPILLGYAFNLEQVTEQDYKATTDTVNVTPLLQNDVEYTYAHGSIYQMNTNTGVMMPFYNSITGTKSSLPMSRVLLDNSWGAVGIQDLTGMDYFYLEPHYDPDVQDISLTPYQNGSPLTPIHYLHSAYYVNKTGMLYIQYYQFGRVYSTAISGGNFDALEYGNSVPSSLISLVLQYSKQGETNTYADLAAGFYFETQPNKWIINLPTNSRSVLLTMDLNSITDPNYIMNFYDTFNSAMALKKTTVGSDVTWQLTGKDGYYTYTDIYYDEGRTSNTIQISIEVSLLEETSGGMGNFQHNIHIDYVGDWPDTIGKANSYWHYELNRVASQYLTADLGELRFSNTVNTDNYNLARSPTMRVDDAYYRAFEYPIVMDRTYSPGEFKTNPATTITNIAKYGTSLEFGGNTYTVSDGNITMGTHEIPVKDLVFSSIPNPGGGYDNKIGNTVISTSAAPSAITFNGKWSASITTTAQEQYEITKTEWKAGSFAWDGMDQNFLMVGLLASLGAFIALGIYARRSRASIWPLLIVCGGAALLFFVML